LICEDLLCRSIFIDLPKFYYNPTDAQFTNHTIAGVDPATAILVNTFTLNSDLSTNMYTGILVSTFLATALAAPLVQRQSPQTGENDSWQSAPDTTTTCDAASDKSISFMRGPQLETVLDNACAAMMPPCAYQDRVAKGTVCTATLDYPLDASKSSTQHANIVDSDGNSISGWDIKCKPLFFVSHRLKY
jgi:hypothetical protein